MRKFIISFSIFLSSVSSQVASDFVFNGAGTSALAGAVTACPKLARTYAQNPASLANKNNTFIYAHQSNVFGLKILPFQSVSLGINSTVFGFTGFTIEQSSVEYRNTQLSSEQSVGINKGFTLHRDRSSSLEIGINFNMLEIKFSNSAGPEGNGSNGQKGSTFDAIGFDIGVLASLRNKYALGAFIKNANHPSIGNGMSKQDLPRRISLGAAYQPLDELMTSIELERELGKEMQVQGGIIFTNLPSVKILMGIQSNPSRMGGGIQFNLSGFEFTWSILSHHILPPTQFYSLGYSFE